MLTVPLSPSLYRTAMTEPDPLLGSGAYIDPAEPHYDDSSEWSKTPDIHFVPGVAIDAKPISMCRPEDATMGAPTPSSRRRNAEEMAKRPNWLPEDWTMELKVRTSGATAGQIDPYYVEPTGQRKFRSKNEVFHFLETGIKRKKRKSAPVAESKPSASPVSQKQKKTEEKKHEPSAPLNSERNVTSNSVS